MELLSLLVVAKLSAMPLATGLYRFEWKRAWVDAAPVERVLYVDEKDFAKMS